MTEDDSEFQINVTQNTSVISRAKWFRLGWNIKIQTCFLGKKVVIESDILGELP